MLGLAAATTILAGLTDLYLFAHECETSAIPWSFFFGLAKVGPGASQAEVLMVASRIFSPALVREVSPSQQLLVVTFGSAQA